jgi:hypothetical protein
VIEASHLHTQQSRGTITGPASNAHDSSSPHLYEAQHNDGKSHSVAACNFFHGGSDGSERALTDDELATLAPDMIIMCATTDVLRATMVTSSWREEIESLPAVKRMRRCPRMFTIDKALLSRAGPRLVEGIERVASLLHQKVFTRSDRDAGPWTPNSHTHVFARDTPSSPGSNIDKHVSHIPQQRCAHTLVSLNTTAWMIGGEHPDSGDEGDGKSTVRCQDVWRLRVEGRAAMWDRISPEGADALSASTAASVFQGRSHHATAMWGERLLVWGGWSDDGTPVSGDIQMFDIKTRQWVQDLTTSGEMPTPRAHACMAVRLGGNSPKAVVYGGWDGTKRYISQRYISIKGILVTAGILV